MSKLKLPFLSAHAYKVQAQSLLKHLRPSAKKVGAPPGTLTYTGEELLPTKINFFQYDKDSYSSEAIEKVSEIKSKISKKHINWIEVTGFENIDTISEIGQLLNIDQLTMEDMLNVGQLPKVEEHDNYLYITLKLVDTDPEEHKISFTHYSLIIMENVLVTFSEKPNKVQNHIEARLSTSTSKLRNSNLDYLSYRIIDTTVDYYYIVLEWFTNILADLEVELIEQPSKKHINTILNFKKQWLILRKAFYPLKEAIRKMVNVDPAYIRSAGKHYVIDLHDHLMSIGETMEILRETLDNLMDLYNSTVSNKMNEVMQVLTIVSTIFIPLTFIAGIYGMNFENMPELSWQNGYFYALGVMLLTGIGMTIFMKRKQWF